MMFAQSEEANENSKLHAPLCTILYNVKKPDDKRLRPPIKVLSIDIMVSKRCPWNYIQRNTKF